MKRHWIAVLIAAFSLASVSAAEAVTETVLYSFKSGADAAEPQGKLLNVAGTLYGTTHAGGIGWGTVFSFNPATGAETVVHVFEGNGDGVSPAPGLISVGGQLYGMTSDGGSGNNAGGTIFKIDPATGSEIVLHTFQDNGLDGFAPYGALIHDKGFLYGTTLAGGTDGNGTVFSFDLKTGTETVLHSFQFNGSDGYQPVSSLLKVGHQFWGTTQFGGTGTYLGVGTIFKITKSGSETVVYSFQFTKTGSDGNYPAAGLTDANGILYGTTEEGGPNTTGTVFRIVPKKGKESVLYSFPLGPDGKPNEGLVKIGHKLYGAAGGGNGNGILFSIDLNTGKEATFYAFKNNGTDGNGPNIPTPVNCTKGASCTLYGTTIGGGTYGWGTIYKITF